MTISTSSKLGVDVNERTVDPRFEVGEMAFGDKGKVLMYVRSSTDIAADTAVLISTADFTITAGAGLYKTGAVAFVTNEYGWGEKESEQTL